MDVKKERGVIPRVIGRWVVVTARRLADVMIDSWWHVRYKR